MNSDPQHKLERSPFKWSQFCERGIVERMDALKAKRERLTKTRHAQSQLNGIDYMISEYEREMMDRGYWK